MYTLQPRPGETVELSRHPYVRTLFTPWASQRAKAKNESRAKLKRKMMPVEFHGEIALLAQGNGAGTDVSVDKRIGDDALMMRAICIV